MIAPFIKGIDHVGYAVEDIDSASKQFSIFGFSFSEKQIDELRRVVVSVGEMTYMVENATKHEKSGVSYYRGGWKVELLSPIDGERSPVDGYLSKIGSTPYHICYQVDDIERAISILQDCGFTLMSSPAPSEPLNGTVCFLYSVETGIIELIER